MARLIQCVNYMVTTFCDRNCPDCCCNIPNKEGKHFDWDYIVESAKYLKGIRRINLSGGGPTFQKFPEIFKYFDVIQVSHYTENSYKDSWNNTEDVNFIIDYLKGTPTQVLVGEIVHVNRSRRSMGLVCERGTSETVSYENGLIYPCCAGPGVDGGKGIPLSDNWLEEIRYVRLPCKNCWFSLP